MNWNAIHLVEKNRRLEAENEKLKAEIKRKDAAIKFVLEMDVTEGYRLHPKSAVKLIQALREEVKE